MKSSVPQIFQQYIENPGQCSNITEKYGKVYKKKNNEEMPEEMKKMFEDVCNEVMKQCGNGAMK